MDLPIQLRRLLLLRALKGWDLAVCTAVLGALWLMHADANLDASANWRVALWLAGSAALLHAVLEGSSAYRSRRRERGAGEASTLTRALALGMLLSSVLALGIGVAGVSLPLMLQAWAAATCIVVAGRFAMRGVLAAVRRSGRNLRHVLVVGSGERARQIVWDLAQPDLGYRIIGCVDDPGRAADAAAAPLLGRISEIDRVLADNVVDEVVIALPADSFAGAAANVMQACQRQGVSVTLPVNFFDIELFPLYLDAVAGTPILRYAAHRVIGWPALLKRAIDVAISVALLLALAPLFALVAVAIKLSSPGAVFFVQERVGLHKRPFRLVKFRTMVADAEARLEQVLHLNEVEGPVFKVRNDPRLTRIGRALRRSSIDELPQLLNVLRGDMSLVGPRPLPLRDVRGFSEVSMRRRFSVKPGITCSWQVSGRSTVAFDKWMELDMRYIENWSLGLDLKILLLTLPAVLRGNGAH